MMQKNKSKIKHGCLLFIFGIVLFIFISIVLIGNYFSKMIPDEAKTRESIKTDPVHQALIQGEILKMKHLLDEGADPNKTIIRGHTPLITASRMGRPKIVLLLLQSGADPKHQDDLGWTPLHHAILEEHSNLLVIKMLVNAGANINAQDHRLRTPLHRAAQYGYIEIVKYLLKVGADPKIKDYSDWTPCDRIDLFGTADAATNVKIKKILKENQ